MQTRFIKRFSITLCLLALLTLPHALLALSLSDADAQVNELIAEKKIPDGVVFELVSRNPKLLETVLPRVQNMVSALKQAYPKLDIAVVSHGREMFALTKENAASSPESHKAVRSLLGGNVKVHVCGAYAEHKKVDQSAFPEYIDVASHGPELIRDYLSLGYTHIKIRTDN